MVADMSRGAALLAGNREVLIARLEVGGVARFGFIVDRTRSGEIVVFLPGAPSALSGMVLVAKPDQVMETPIQSGDLMATMKRLGNGLGGLAGS